MTEKKFETILAVLAEKLEAQENEIGYLRWKCRDLERILSEAEAEGQKKTSENIDNR